MKTVLAAGAHFDPIELYGVVGIEMEIEALEKEGGVHAIRGCDGAGDGGVVPVLEAKDAGGTADVLYGAACTVDCVRVGRVLESENVDGGARSSDGHLFRDVAVCDGVGICDAGQRIEGALKFRTEFCRSVLAGPQRHRVLCSRFGEAEDVPAGVHIVESRGDTAVDEFDADDIFEGAAEGPAKGISSVVGHEVAVTAIDGDGYGALFSVLA